MNPKDASNDPTPHLRLGKAGENAAAAILRRNGYSILDQNWRHGHLELDIVCEKDGIIVFVEVKTRAGSRFGGAVGAITPIKQKKIIQASQAWLASHDADFRPCRFDAICLTAGNGAFSVEHYPDAFQFSWSMDSGNASGQSW